MFIKYPHIERLGNDEVEGILDGVCHIMPKIDGTNASVWLEENEPHAGSRRRKLSVDDDNAGFYQWLLNSETGDRVVAYLNQYPSRTLYGEWMVPHSLKTYRKDAWRRFYVFDVFDRETGQFLPYDEYIDGLDAFGIDAIPVLEVCEYPTEEHLLGLLDKNTFLIEDGNGVGEGIVVKRYGFVNSYGRTTWAKLVRNEFKEKNAKAFGAPKVSMLSGIELELAETYVTAGRIQKVLDKMTEADPWSSRRIPELFNRVWNDLITDEMWNIIKKHKNPTIDFKQFHNAVVRQVKATKPELF